jgi:hypothetical protein
MEASGSTGDAEDWRLSPILLKATLDVSGSFVPNGQEYGLGRLSNGIWKGQPWGMTIREVIDGLVYGLLTAGTFGWLWPRSTMPAA